MDHRTVGIVPGSNADASVAFYRRSGFAVVSDHGRYHVLADGKGWHIDRNHVPGEPWAIEDNPFGLYRYVDDVDADAARFSDLIITSAI